jgi:(4-(4-[2-(gamma-L-glutamylamino)ethyl]phenoxymethyl)furan-2-yl)methanamine synthase
MSMSMNTSKTKAWVMGWDIGGAQVKMALLQHGVLRFAKVFACPLWQGLPNLDRAIHEAKASALAFTGASDVSHAVTMTGELVDLFDSREQGVKSLVQTLQTLLPNMQVFAGMQGFVSAQQALVQHKAVASANWLATAQALQHSLSSADESRLLIDIGSTTTDIIPLTKQGIRAKGQDDFSRLAHDELLYTGCIRTPLMALGQRMMFDGKRVNLMAEYFATMADVYRLTGELDEASDLHAAADNGAKTIAGSARRIARMVGRDADSAPLQSWKDLATQFAVTQQHLIAVCVSRVLARMREAKELQAAFAQPQMVLTGSGAFIGEKVAAQLLLPHTRLSQVLKLQDVAQADSCAPAVAVAQLLNRWADYKHASDA